MVVARSTIPMTINGMQHPMARLNFFCRPDLVRGMPIFLDILLLVPEMPSARFQENEKPNFLVIRYLLPYSCLPHHQATLPMMAK